MLKLDTVDLVVGLVSGTLSMITFFLPTPSKRPKLWHAAYIGIATFLVCVVVAQWQRARRIDDIARTADAMIANREMNYSSRGYALAALSFIEKHRDLYPDTYRRAVELCTGFKCDQPGSTDIVELAFAFDGLLKGISTQAGGQLNSIVVVDGPLPAR